MGVGPRAAPFGTCGKSAVPCRPPAVANRGFLGMPVTNRCRKPTLVRLCQSAGTGVAATAAGKLPPDCWRGRAARRAYSYIKGTHTYVNVICALLNTGQWLSAADEVPLGCRLCSVIASTDLEVWTRVAVATRMVHAQGTCGSRQGAKWVYAFMLSVTAYEVGGACVDACVRSDDWAPPRWLEGTERRP